MANGLFVAAEFAIVGATAGQHRAQAAQGSRLARRVVRILEDPSDRTATSPRRRSASRSPAWASACTASTRSRSGSRRWFAPFGVGRWIAAHTLASVIAIAILTYLHIVIGEMVPKALALQRARRPCSTCRRSSRRSSLRLPVVVGLNAIGNGLLRMIGIRRREVDTERYHTTRGAAVHHPGKPGRRPAARRVGAHPAGAVRVRRPDGSAR